MVIIYFLCFFLVFFFFFIVSFRMIPASNKAFVVNNLVSGTAYDLCVLAIWDDTATTLTATNIVGCAQFFTQEDYQQCQSMHSQFLGGTMILVIGGIIVATLLVFIVILMVRYKICNNSQGKMADVTNVYSQTNGGNSVQNGVPLQVNPKVVVRNELMEFNCGSVHSSVSSSSSSVNSPEGDDYSLQSNQSSLSHKWRRPVSRSKPNIDRLMGAFASLELRCQKKEDAADSRTSTTVHLSDKEPLLGNQESKARSHLMLPLEGKAKRSHSFDMGDFAATQCCSYPRKMTNIWTRRSLSVNGMLLQYDDSELVGNATRCTYDSSEWVMESTV